MFYVGLIAFVVGVSTLIGVVLSLYALEFMWKARWIVFGKQKTVKRSPDISDARSTLALLASPSVRS